MSYPSIFKSENLPPSVAAVGSPPRAKTNNWLTLVLVLIYTTGVFALDCWLPANAAISMLFVISPVLAMGSGRVPTLLLVGAAVASLTVIGHLIDWSGPNHWDDAFAHRLIMGRITTLASIALMCLVGRQLLLANKANEQLQIQGRLRQVADEAATFFRRLVDQVPIGISQSDLHGRLTFANESFCQLWRGSRDDILGKTTCEVVAAPLRETTRQDEQTVASRHVRLERIETVPHVDRTQFLKVIRTPIIDLDGQLLGVQSIWVDITELKQAEQGLEQYAQNLERTNIDLRQFAYVASHDLQEPLRAVSGYCQLLERNYLDTLDERGVRWLQFVVKGAQRMQALVQDLLVYARIENNTAEWSLVSSRTACLKAVESLQPRLKEAGATIMVGDLPTVLADSTQLEQLFQNLIGNAVKFRRPDVPPEVYISARRIKEGWRFTVRDNGIGIKEEFQQRVFEIFKRLHSQDEYPGTGIGLAICKRIVERYNGRIWVRSQPGVGSTFYFVLPIMRRPMESRPQEPAADEEDSSEVALQPASQPAPPATVEA